MKKLLLIFICFVPLYFFAQNKNISNGIVFDGEPYLTINPNNTQHIVATWMGYKFGEKIVIKTKTSFDGGLTWSPKVEIPHITTGNQSADPSLAFDNNGNVYLCFIDFIPFPAAGAVYVAKSIDGGLSWNTPVEVINVTDDSVKYPVDRPWMVIDKSGGVYDGNIYITTMNPNVFGPVSPPYHPYFIKSVDGGQTFEPWRYLDTTNYLAGSLIPQPMPTPAISSNGTFYAIYPSYVVSQSLFAQYFIAYSADAGNSFNYHTAMQSSGSTNDTLAKKGYLLISNPADVNHLCFFYPGNDNGDLDVNMIESFDAGANWTLPIRINDDPIANNKMQDLIWADFDLDGDIVVAWRDRRNAPDTTYKTSSEIFGAFRRKDSISFSTNFNLSNAIAPHDTVLEESGNDFMCIKMQNDTVYSIWGDVRNGKLNIWFQQLDLSSGATLVKNINEDDFNISVYPNPTTDFISIKTNHKFKELFYQIRTLDGKSVIINSTLLIDNKIDLRSIAKGNYLLILGNNTFTKVFRIFKQ